jgi:pyruvate kinase
MNFAKTKIIATIGPSSNSYEVISQMLDKGLDILRLNLSHGKIEEHIQTIVMVREMEKKLNRKIAIMGDLQGPKIRIGNFENNAVELFENDTFIITSDDLEFGNNRIVASQYKDLVKEVHPGNLMLLDDGYIHLECTKIIGNEIHTKVIKGGILKNHKGIVVPGSKSNAPSLSEKDIEDLKNILPAGIDLIALSFVKSDNDIREARTAMKIFGRQVPVIAKIERAEAFDKIDNIILESDGIMVARGDLGLEMPMEEIPLLQKELIRKANINGKPVITATQMLESMIHNPMPTRAEITDVANAVIDGTDAVMLSGETSVGDYPILAVDYMNKIILKTENAIVKKLKIISHNNNISDNIADSIAISTVLLSKNIQAKAILTVTQSSYTPRKISKYRPNIPIIAFTDEPSILSYLMLIWGVRPIYLPELNPKEYDFRAISDIAQKYDVIQKDDLVVFVSGLTESAINENNMIKVISVD